VIGLDGWEGDALPAGARIGSVRDLGAVVATATFVAGGGSGAGSGGARPTERDVEEHQAVVDAVFSRHSLLPAPVGVVFRSEDAVLRWLELHYVTLSDGLRFTEGRIGTRVHVSVQPSTGDRPDGTNGSELGPMSSDLFRVLREHAVAAVSLRSGRGSDRRSVAFLVERDVSRTFEEVVADEAARRPSLLVECTGPWPPHDFIKMHFGA
jgi:hypothetical protein